MTDDRPFEPLIQSIDRAMRQRQIDSSVRAAEAAARRDALSQLRQSTQSWLSGIRGELQGLGGGRRFTRLRIRSEMRAQLLNLNADVERLRQQVRQTLARLRREAAEIAAADQQRVADLRATIGEEAGRRRQQTQALLSQFAQARAETAGHMRQQLSGYRDGLRQATSQALTAHRAERARQTAAWHSTRARRVEPSAPPVTLVDPRESLPPALAALAGKPAAPDPVARDPAAPDLAARD